MIYVLLSVLQILTNVFNPTPKLIFADDFLGTKLNETYWNYNLGDGCPTLCGWGNREHQIYTKENIYLEDGNLIITATNDGIIESGRIHTKDKVEFKYGTVEVRAKLPVGKGVWPAIWMLGHDIAYNTWPACGEIDIMEYAGKQPSTIHTSLHTPDSHGQTINTSVTEIPSLEQDFHVYKAKWDADSIRFFIDETLVYTFSPKVKNNNNWPFDKPFYLILNFAVGGTFAGNEIDPSIFPQKFIIDYVKVYDLGEIN